MTPDSIELSKLPEIKEANPSLETLLGFTQDLNARLTVLLRRNQELEQKNIEHAPLLAQKNEDLKLLIDKYEILSEKHKHASDRVSEQSEYTQKLKLQFTKLEEKLKAKVNKTHELQAEIESYKIKQNKLLEIQKEVRTQIKPEMQRLMSHNKSLGDSLDRTEKEKAQLLTQNSEMQSKLTELTQSIKERYQSLTQKHNEQLRIWKEKYEKILEENHHFQDQALSLKSVMTEKTKIENQLIEIQNRKIDESQGQRKHIEELKQEIKRLADELKSEKADNHELKKSWSLSHRENQNLSEEKEALEKRLEDFEFLWNQKDLRLSQHEARIESLQKMNGDLASELRKLKQD